MDKDEIIRQLKRENEPLKGCLRELVANLAMTALHIPHQV